MNIVLDFGRFCCSTLYPRWPLLSPQRPVDPSLFCHALKHAWWDGLGCTRKLIMTHRHGRHRHSWQTWHNSFSNVLASCLPFADRDDKDDGCFVLLWMGQKPGRDATLWLETIAPDQGLLWWMSIESRNSMCSSLAALWQISLMLTGYWSLLSLISQADLIRICRGWNVHVLFLCREQPRIDFLTVQRVFGWLLERKFDWRRADGITIQENWTRL